MALQSDLPNVLAPDTEKNSKEFGLRFMRTVYEKWNGGYSGESASERANRYAYNRAFAQGKQPMEEYKDILDLDGKMSVINLDYSPLPIAIPFINRMNDRYMQRDEKIQCNAVDPVSQSKKEKAKADALFKMKNKERIMALQQEAGVEIEEFSEGDPKDERELELNFGFTYKEREEVIMEQGIDLVFYDNDFKGVIKKRVLWDLVTAGIAQLKPYIDANGRIKIRFTKPENIISGYTEWDDFRDAPYQGEVYYMDISSIRLKYPNKISEEKLYELAKSQAGRNGNSSQFNYEWNSNYSDAIARPYDAWRVMVAEVDLKAIYNLTYETKNDKFGKEVLNKVKKKQPNKKYVEKPYEVDYLGVWVVETDYLLEWGIAKNQVKEEKNLAEVKLPWVTYMYNNDKMMNKPLIETMIPSIKKMQLVELQQQKIIANAAPDGFKVDISTMSDITLGEGMEDLSPFDLYKIYKQTGVQYYKGIPDESSEGQARNEPIQPMNVPFSGKLEQLMGVWNQEYDKLMRIVGSNNLDAGNITNQATGKTVLQEARQIGESASNYIYEGFINMMTRCAKITQLRLWDILVHGKKFGVTYYDGYMQALGSDRIEYIKLEATDDLEKANFDVKIQCVIDDKEAVNFEQNLQISLANQLITTRDATEARLLAKTNIKYAIYFLAYREEKKKKEDREIAKENSADNTQQAIAAAQEKNKGDMELEQMKHQNQLEIDSVKQTSMKEEQILKFNSIAKTETLKAMLTQGLNIQQIQQQAPWIFDGLAVANATATAIMEEDLNQIAVEQEIQAQEEEQMAMQEEQQMMEQQGAMEPQMQ